MMAAIGTGNVKSGIVTVSLGTSGTIFTCSEKPVIDPTGLVAAFCDGTNRWLPVCRCFFIYIYNDCCLLSKLICTMNVTVATEVFALKKMLLKPIHFNCSEIK